MDSTARIYTIFCEAWLSHDTKKLSQYVADTVLCKNEKGEETLKKEDFLLWVQTFYKQYAVLEKSVSVTAKTYINEDQSFIYTVIDDINEYDITLDIENETIVGLLIRQSFLSFGRERKKILLEGINAAKLIIDEYVEQDLDERLFRWILDKPIEMWYAGIDVPHLKFSYNGKMYGVIVEVYGNNYDDSAYTYKSDFDAFIRLSKEENFIACLLQIDKETMKPCHSQGLLLDALSDGFFIELNPQKS